MSSLLNQTKIITKITGANEKTNGAPRMLKLTLTDREIFIQVIKTSTILFISREKTFRVLKFC